MDLKIKDVSELLNVSETTIRRWLVGGKIPAYRLNGQYRFSRVEIEDWVMNRKLGQIVEVDRGEEETKTSKSPLGLQQFSLYRAIHKGGVYSHVPGENKETIFRKTSQLVAERFNWDADALADLLLDREALMPTSLNNGIGVPHSRELILQAHLDAIVIIFPQKPIEYGALDGKAVHTLFFLFASEDKKHLHLLAKLAHLCSQADSLNFLHTKPNQEKLLAYIRKWESNSL